MGLKQDKKTKSVSRQQMIVKVNRALDKGAETGSLPRGSRDADGLLPSRGRVPEGSCWRRIPDPQNTFRMEGEIDVFIQMKPKRICPQQTHPRGDKSSRTFFLRKEKDPRWKVEAGGPRAVGTCGANVGAGSPAV